MRLRLFWIVMAVPALTAACRGATPVPVAAPPPPVLSTPIAAAPAPVISSWSYRPTTDRHAFVLGQRALVTIKQDTLVRVDTVSSRADVTFATTNARIVGSINAFVAGGGRKEPAPIAGVRFPVVLSAVIPTAGNQVVFFAPTSNSPCESLATTVAQSVRDLWFRAPDSLWVGATWSDSARYAICRDGIPLQLQVTRAFRVTGSSERNGRVVLAVLRTSRTSLTGEGDQFGEHVSMTAAGTGELTYEIAPMSGELLGAHGSSVLEMTFQSALRKQQVRQTADILLSRAN